MSEMQKLLQSLREMVSESKANVLNNRETWSKIGNREIEELGFESEEELKEFILNNPYSNV